MTDVTDAIAEREAVLAQLRGVLIDRLRIARAPDELDAAAPLFGAGFALDSLDAVELVVSLDTLFGIVLEEGVLLRQQMRTLDTLADLVLAHRSGRVAR